MVQRLRAAMASPLAWILAGLFALYAVGLGWGLPSSDPWDNDGVAPRDFLVGVAQTFDRQGFDFAYLHLAPFHLVLLAALTLPVTLWALASSPSTAPEALVRTFIEPRFMTPIAWIARGVSVAMALGAVLALARVAEEVRGKRAGAMVALACGTNAALVYYAHATNLEVPYLFWGASALRELVRAIARREPRRLRRFAVLGALAIGSKDQAAGLFLVGAPAALLAWVAWDGWARDHARAVAREALLALGLAAVLFLVVDEVVVNPWGFTARVRFLLGPASQDWNEYTKDLSGRVAVLADVVARAPWVCPSVFLGLGALGVTVAARAPRALRAAALAPLAFALSFTVCISMTTWRTDPRFLLPQTLFLGFYAGLALDALLALPAGGPLGRWILRGVAAASLGWSALRAADVDAVLLGDPRYDAEAWMRAHVAPGDRVEVYGRNVYLPRFPEGAVVERVDPGPTAGRSPLPGVLERQDAWAGLAERRPKWISVSRAWAWRFLEDPEPPRGAGRTMPRWRVVDVDDETTTYFRALLAGQLGYRVVHTSAFSSALWPVFQIHGSVGEPVWTLERID